MGYTHYWELARPLTADDIAALADDIGRIAATVENLVPLTGWDGSGEPEYGPERIAYNGWPKCETFALSVGDSGFDFCKTRQRPYDIVVTASLLALKDRLGADVRLSSDGGTADWLAGHGLAKRALGRPIAAFQE